MQINWIDKLDKYLETHNLAKLNNEEMKNLKRSATTKQIESAIKKLFNMMGLKPSDFTDNLYQTYKK